MNKKETPVYDWKKINRECFERDRLEQQTKNKVDTLLNNKKNATPNRYYPRTKPF